ncbi:hypothetical protein P170DRAFT_464844 [Aspergillus steynii IBT 23096]|uniref:DEUBAD domain-containing protein n=1 Tax=Aspergillus steynii IBT 23096 TaxID=1392250 RepID=A0A2I2G952_9EURO|nr:uncharacterized protein P170DRAFT_464844 [Aspergillus steynii IBT 23096]PLB49416.1 hypothetical protein P170DRAFT_464844 [Aspergillus steynii IBT 23096]
MSTTNTRPKRNPRRAAKDPWEEERLMTSSESPLVHLDLVKLLARPEAWEILEESEKKEILSLLPEDVHPNPHPPADDPDWKIPPLPESFLRYSNNWRDGVRQFQVDLESGRYDPEWLRQAEEASAQRAAGKFDKFKEREYEEFWGQKQKFDRSLAAGQSSQVKLQTLIEHGVVRAGDVWRYSRCFMQGSSKILLEKEVKFLSIDGPRLTFAMPFGQRVFLSNSNGHAKDSEPSAQSELSPPKPAEVETDESKKTNEEAFLDGNGAIEIESSKKRKSDAGPSGDKPPAQKRRRGQSGSTGVAKTRGDCDQEAASNTDCKNPDTAPVGIDCHPAEENPAAAAVDEAKNGDQARVETPSSANASEPGDKNRTTRPASPSICEQHDDVVVSGITGLNSLAAKIVEVDGRLKKMPRGNAWKEFRSYRNNQDMGSLWEVRQAWFLKTQ